MSTARDGAQIRAAFKVASPFLRRSELLEVLSSRPTDRFQYFESFLGIEKVDRVIDGLTIKRAATEGRITQLAARSDAALGTLFTLLPSTYQRPGNAREQAFGFGGP